MKKQNLNRVFINNDNEFKLVNDVFAGTYGKFITIKLGQHTGEIRSNKPVVKVFDNYIMEAFLTKEVALILLEEVLKWEKQYGILESEVFNKRIKNIVSNYLKINNKGDEK